MSFADYTEEDQQLHDFVITHNRKLRDIKTIVNNIMWSFYALCDAFEGFQFIAIDEDNICNIVTSFGFTPLCNKDIMNVIDKLKIQTRSVHKYNVLQPIARKHDLLPSDILKVAKTNFTDLCNKL